MYIINWVISRRVNGIQKNGSERFDSSDSASVEQMILFMTPILDFH